jgi:uncharacterized protein YbjT (DUF2867 family)
MHLGFYRSAPGVRDANELALPMGGGKTSPISAVDVARAVSVVLDDPTPHIGQIYNLTGFESACDVGNKYVASFRIMAIEGVEQK